MVQLEILNGTDNFRNLHGNNMTASVVKWSDFLAADPEVPVSIPGAARFSE
jgi:hypothetical protein